MPPYAPPQAPATRRYSGASASGYPQQLPPAAYAASAALPPSPAGALVAANAQPGPAPVPQYRDYPQSPFPAGQEADYIVPTRFAGQEADYVVPTRFESDEQVMRRLSNGSGFSDSRPSTPLRQPLYQAFPEDYGAAYKIAGAAPVRSKSPGVATAYQTPGYQGPTYQAAAYQTPTYQSPGSPAYQGYGAPELRSRSPFVGRELPFDASPQVPQVPVQPPVQQGPPPAAPYGQQPPAAPYGQQPPAAPYGQQPAQYGPPGAAPPAAFGAPPPPAPAEWEYAPPALQPQRKSGLISRAGRLFHRDKGDTMANGLALRRFAPVAGDCLAVSSKANPRDAAHFVPPFTLTVPAEDANRRIIQILMTQSQSRTLVNEGPYIRFEIQLPGLDACDDMEYEFDKRHGVVHVRCEQRGGPSDINGLVARVTSIFTMLEEDIHKFPHPGEAPGVYYQ